jgi:hypothetical protein
MSQMELKEIEKALDKLKPVERGLKDQRCLE